MPAPGVGASCGPCPDGFMGDGEKCAGKYPYLNCSLYDLSMVL